MTEVGRIFRRRKSHQSPLPTTWLVPKVTASMRNSRPSARRTSLDSFLPQNIGAKITPSRITPAMADRRTRFRIFPWFTPNRFHPFRQQGKTVCAVARTCAGPHHSGLTLCRARPLFDPARTGRESMKEAGAIDKRERENQFEPFVENPPFLW